MTTTIKASDFLDDVVRAFADLIHRDRLAVLSSTYDAAAFGNAAVELDGANIRLRVVRDRGQVLVDVTGSDEPSNWSSLQRVLRVVGGSDTPSEGIITTDEAAHLVAKYYSELQDAFSDRKVGATRVRLGELEQEAIRSFVERAKRSNN